MNYVARELLKSYLTPEQRDELARTHHFTVTVPWKKVLPFWRRRFQIHLRDGGNVKAMNRRGHRREGFCLVQRKNDYMPVEDLALTILFRLRTRTRRTLLLGALPLLFFCALTLVVGGILVVAITG